MLGHRPMTLDDYLNILRRRRWYIIVPFLLGPIAALGIAYLLPSRYTSRSLLVILRQRVPSSVVQPVVTENLNARLATMQEQIFSRTRLEPIIEHYGLFKNESKSESMEQLVRRLRDDIKLTVIQPQVASGNDRNSPPGFYVAVTLDNPRTAQQVCTHITSMFVEENLRERERAAQGTTNFLQNQLNDAKQSLDQQDARVAAFERKYFGMLPSQTQTNLNLLQALNTQLQTVTQAINRAELDKTYTQSMLEQQMASWKKSNAAVKSGQPTQETLKQQLSGMQDRLVKLQSEYTNNYPDVIRLKAEILQLKKQMAAQKALSEKASVESAENVAAGLTAKGQAKTQKAGTETASVSKVNATLATEPPSIQQLQNQLHSDEDAIRLDTAQEAKLHKQIKLYESRLQLSPTVQEEYKQITRDHETALLVYNNLLKKRDESEMATDLERAQQGEQFVIMDPASLPKKPSFPSRKKFAGGGLGGGLALGLGLVLLLEMLDKSLRSEADVEALLGVLPLATIPLVEGFRSRKGEVVRKDDPVKV